MLGGRVVNLQPFARRGESIHGRDVDQDVDATEPFYHGIDGALDGGLVTYVEFEGRRLISEERHRADFDALAHDRIGGRVRIVESAMAQESRAAVGLRLKGLEQHDVLGRHLRKVPPAMGWRVAHHEDLPGAVAVTQLHLEHVALGS